MENSLSRPTNIKVSDVDSATCWEATTTTHIPNVNRPGSASIQAVFKVDGYLCSGMLPVPQ